MAIANISQRAFTGGEWTPKLEGRSDIDGFTRACSRLENFLVWPHGPAQRRPGTKYIAEVKTSSESSRLIPIVVDSSNVFILEFGDLYIRFYKNQSQITSGGSAYELVSPYLEADLANLRWCQDNDKLYIFHEDYAPRQLIRTTDTSWALSTINFKPGALSEEGFKPATTLTLGAATGLGVTFTAGAAAFLNGDVGREITSGTGRAVITAFTSTTVVTCDIIDDFASVGPIASQSWTIEGSPNSALRLQGILPIGSVVKASAAAGKEVFTDCLSENQNWWTASTITGWYYLINTASAYIAAEPEGIYVDGKLIRKSSNPSAALITRPAWFFGDLDTLGYNTIYIRLNDDTDPDTKSPLGTPNNDYVQRTALANSKDIFRSTDVGKFLKANDGILKITKFISATSVEGQILKGPSSGGVDEGWTLQEEVWNDTNGYPKDGCFFEERLVLAGSTAFPQTVWGSGVDEFTDFSTGVLDTDAFEFTLSARGKYEIVWIEPRDYLLIGTLQGPWRLGPESAAEALTPLNVVAKQRTDYNCANVHPLSIQDSTIFVQLHNKKLREFTFQWETNGYKAPDLVQLAEHAVVSGIDEIVYQQEPFSIIWARNGNGRLLSLTYLREEGIVALQQHPMDNGTIESLAVIPGSTNDDLYLIVNRTIDGATARYVEVLTDIFTDTAAEYTSNNGLNAFLVDSGITYNGASTTTITGLDHLEGETVSILADGGVQADKTVSSGQITLDVAASVVHVGLPYTSILQTMQLDAAFSNGSSHGKIRQIIDSNIRVDVTGSFEAGRNSSNLDATYDRDRTFVLGQAYPLFSGNIRTWLEGEFDRESRIWITQSKPQPLTIVLVSMEINFTK